MANYFIALRVFRMWKITIACCLSLLVQGCATQAPYTASSLSSDEKMCLVWLENIESTFKENHINDPASLRIKGFPHLRFNRFLASLSDRITTPDAFAEWMEQARQLDSNGKKLEFSTLPASAKQQLVAKNPIDGSFSQALDDCGSRLNQLSLNNPEHKKTLLEQAQVPDAYQSWKRAIGLYPIARYFAAMGIDRLHRKLNASFGMPLDELPQEGELVRYVPPISSQLSPVQIAAIMGPAYAYNNPLGIPRLTTLQLQQLLAHFAPAWEIDTRNDTDKVGAVYLGRNGQPQIDISQPTVYSATGYTRWHGTVLLELIYQIWLPAREKTGLFDLYGGQLDSVIWRVTLSPEGTPVAYDSIHACGCYYLLFPGRGYRAIPAKDGAEAVLSPKSLSSVPLGQRLLLRLQGQTHYLQQVAHVGNSSGMPGRSYKFQSLEDLRSIKMPDGPRRSLYSEDGLVDASARAERLLFWPFGIASPGAMRQWGTHAIAFIGKRHFDDPFLLEKLLDVE